MAFGCTAKFYLSGFSVETEADFWPPAGAGAPADQVQGQPAEFRGTCCTPVTPEAPVAAGVPVLSEVLYSFCSKLM